jgi:hypothetical protein
MQTYSLKRRYLALIQVLLVLAVLALLSPLGAMQATSGTLVARIGEGKLDFSLGSVAVANHAQAVAAAHQATISPPAAFDALNRRAGGALEAKWDPVTGIPRWLAGNNGTTRIPYVPTAAERGNPAAIARGFLDENRDLFRLASVGAD